MRFDLEDVASVRAWVAQRPAEHAGLLRALLLLPLFGRWRDVARLALESQCANSEAGFANPHPAPVPRETEGKRP